MTTTSNCSAMLQSPLISGTRDPGLGTRKSKSALPRRSPFSCFAESRVPSPESRLPLHPKQHAMRVLELVLDVHQEQHRVLAVDDAVVVAQGDVHHRRGDDLSV